MESLWNSVKKAVKERVPDHSFRMWIEPLDFQRIDNGHIVLACPNTFSRKRILDQYGDLIREELTRVTDESLEFRIDIAVRDRPKETAQLRPERQMALPFEQIRPHWGRLLRRDFTFDQFVVGQNNDFAYSASLSMASRKNGHQNPLYLLSPSGMGKSHLSQAIGHYIMSEYPRERVYYMTAEDFSSEMVRAYRNNEIDKFKEKYRNYCDVLLLEDVHQLSGKERTQVELAASLDFLCEASKKIIFSSCYLPAEIPKINAQLRSRLSNGLISAIERPNFRTRVRILKHKAGAKGYALSDDVIQFMASELTEDIRQLESGLIGISARSSLLGAPIDLQLAGEVVRNIIRRPHTITIDAIKKLVCKEFQISLGDIVSRSRKQAIVRPRQIAIYLARKYTDSPLQAIGRSFNRYHATALHSISVVEKGIKANGAMKQQIQYLRDRLDTGNY